MLAQDLDRFLEGRGLERLEGLADLLHHLLERFADHPVIVGDEDLHDRGTLSKGRSNCRGAGAMPAIATRRGAGWSSLFQPRSSPCRRSGAFPPAVVMPAA